MKMPPTFCHMGNKSASFIPILIILSAAPLFGYSVCPLPRNGGTDNAASLTPRKENEQTLGFSKKGINHYFSGNIIYGLHAKYDTDDNVLHERGKSLSLRFWYNPDSE